VRTLVKTGQTGPYDYEIHVNESGAFKLSMFDRNGELLETFPMNNDDLLDFEIKVEPVVEATAADIYGGLCGVGRYCRGGFCDAPSDQPSDERVSARGS
jgi:hypothetical protein